MSEYLYKSNNKLEEDSGKQDSETTAFERLTEKRYSEHTWISSIPAKVENLHELFNLGMRKMWLIEDSFNTEKNRGYNYKHAFADHWNAMQGFHLLMRLAHAINALSEFTKSLKKYIHSLGCSATMKLIKETLFSPWLSLEWYDAQ
jgi:hypothetical protein